MCADWEKSLQSPAAKQAKQAAAKQDAGAVHGSEACVPSHGLADWLHTSVTLASASAVTLYLTEDDLANNSGQGHPRTPLSALRLEFQGCYAPCGVQSSALGSTLARPRSRRGWQGCAFSNIKHRCCQMCPEAFGVRGVRVCERPLQWPGRP